MKTNGPYGCEEYLERRWQKCFATADFKAALEWMTAGDAKRARRICGADGGVKCGTYAAGEIMYRQGVFDGQADFEFEQ